MRVDRAHSLFVRRRRNNTSFCFPTTRSLLARPLFLRSQKKRKIQRAYILLPYGVQNNFQQIPALYQQTTNLRVQLSSVSDDAVRLGPERPQDFG